MINKFTLNRPYWIHDLLHPTESTWVIVNKINETLTLKRRCTDLGFPYCQFVSYHGEWLTQYFPGFDFIVCTLLGRGICVFGKFVNTLDCTRHHIHSIKTLPTKCYTIFINIRREGPNVRVKKRGLTNCNSRIYVCIARCTDERFTVVCVLWLRIRRFIYNLLEPM